MEPWVDLGPCPPCVPSSHMEKVPMSLQVWAGTSQSRHLLFSRFIPGYLKHETIFLDYILSCFSSLATVTEGQSSKESLFRNHLEER